ncbi:casein kinase 2 regulatory subunit [Yamadazyma tenuis]|uniref:Casein kinase II subunit beta n=1 Tax=Candida tenuis (strain ATCC 10573 / BCRC 21748 / CBS 615 / JCM 9827 / NBRC 10315 / NRRL Y-1498 / VKM Y-70) TaxID=590646 RepID=G3BF66_CANTC|nr:casein kinase II, regulatory subunit [Yamadazyma tenuis ATCC 10573]EGV60652.1 casein kinase II, regulatory subunit [Yamadazyma tenuis ATCC 10573]WEJ94097.1 casein kinase 2 regulatory subunit [Yamadazyma tenuis]
MSSGGEDDYVPWIQQFCNLFGHDYFVPISQEFIEDDFNLTGLSSQVPYYREALYTILDYQVDTADDSSNSGSKNKGDLPNKALLAHSAELLYGLIHARYIISKPGLTAMASKFERNEFGSCPRLHCDGMHLMPCGATDLPGQETVRLYCPCCNDIYLPSSSRYLNIDGAFFGTTFPGLLIRMFPEIEHQCKLRIDKVNQDESGLRLFGFKVNEMSASGPRMKWLRMHPKSTEQKKEFDSCQLTLPSSDEMEEEDDDVDEEQDDDDDNTMASSGS